MDIGTSEDPLPASGKKPYIVLIVQVRMGATRLPGKPLKKILDRPLLSYQIERLRRAKRVDKIVIATTLSPRDQEIVNLCQREGISIYRGSEEDVLDRYYRAANTHRADIIVRITGDCPLIDPEIVDQVIDFYSLKIPNYDYVSNSLQRTYPRGLDVEVFSFQALEKAAKEATLPEEREHVTLFFYEHPEIFSLGSMQQATDESAHRWTVDTEEDFQLISLLINTLYPSNPHFTSEDVLAQIRQHPEWALINAHIKQKPVR